MSWVFTASHRGGNGPPLVCLHGLTDTWRTWARPVHARAPPRRARGDPRRARWRPPLGASFDAGVLAFFVATQEGLRSFAPHAEAFASTRRAGEITIVDREGGLVDAPLAPTSELPFHLAIYARYDAGAVVHTHPSMATAVACVADELPCIHYSLLALGGNVRVARYATFGTDNLAKQVVNALEGRTAALMASHGAVTYGADLQAAIDATELLEWRARCTSTRVRAGCRGCSPRTSARQSSTRSTTAGRGRRSTRSIDTLRVAAPRMSLQITHR